MPDNPNQYDNPLISRYASPEMSGLWSPQRKFSTWRRLWVALAEAEAELGLPITRQQIEQLRAHLDDIDFEAAARYERKLRHDVMAHVHAYGDLCPDARPIIHLGATSCYVTDNTDLLLLREGLQMIRGRLLAVIESLAAFAAKHRDLPCLGFTHFQPAQPTTVGKRACLWAYDFVMDLAEIEHRIAEPQGAGQQGHDRHPGEFLGAVSRRPRQGAQAGGIDLPQDRLRRRLCRQRADLLAEDRLAGPRRAVRRGPKRHKMATDLRLLAHRKEVEEPFEKDQIGSSAMAYKRNPMRSERICSLARFVSTPGIERRPDGRVQWLERTLDDSANRRLTLPQAFLAADAVLILCQNVTAGLVVYPKVIAAAPGGRVALHGHGEHPDGGRGGRRRPPRPARADSPAQLRPPPRWSKSKAGRTICWTRLAADPAFAKVDLAAVMEPSQFVGRAPEQVDEFIAEVVGPIRAKYASRLGLAHGRSCVNCRMGPNSL